MIYYQKIKNRKLIISQAWFNQKYTKGEEDRLKLS